MSREKEKCHGKQRSGHWHTVRSEFLETYPSCFSCGGTNKIEVHHILPFHLHPELELDPHNLISLCEGRKSFNCHLIVGHKLNFKDVNPDVVRDAAYLKKNLFKL